MKVDKEIERSIQLKILDILLEIDRVCKKNNIKYYLAYGTGIGAIRHKGFIPWDDDADIFMFKEDYKKFEQVCKGDLNDNFFLQNSSTDKNYKMSLPKVRMNNTAFVEGCTRDWDIHHGIYVDIFILDECPKNKKIQDMNIRIIRGTELSRRGFYTMKNKKNIIKKLMIPLFYHNIILNTWNTLVFNPCKKDPNLCIDRTASGIVFPSNFFGEPRDIEFEGHMLSAPKDLEGFLEHFYGDYMTPPPEEKRVSHHDIVHIDLENPYKK